MIISTSHVRAHQYRPCLVWTRLLESPDRRDFPPPIKTGRVLHFISRFGSHHLVGLEGSQEP